VSLLCVQFCTRCAVVLWPSDAVGWAAGRASGLQKTEWWSAGVVICLERGADLHMAQLMPLPLTVSCFSKIKSRLILPFWYRLTWVVPDKGPLNRCVCVCCSYLHVSGDTYGRPISGQREVSGYSSPSELNQWKAGEGIFLKPTDAGLESRGIHDELWLTVWTDEIVQQSTRCRHCGHHFEFSLYNYFCAKNFGSFQNNIFVE